METPPQSAPQRPALFEFPDGPGTPIGERLMLVRGEGQVGIFLGPTAVNVFDADDEEAQAATIAMLSRANLAHDVDIAAAFGVHRNTVGRLSRRYAVEGMGAVVAAKRGPKAPSKVSEEVLGLIEAHRELRAPELGRLIAEATGTKLSIEYLRQLRRRIARAGAIQDTLASPAPSKEASPETKLPELPAEAPEASEAGAGDDHEPAGPPEPSGQVGGKEAPEQMAGAGSSPLGGSDEPSFDPPAVLPTKTRGRYMGAALFYPAIAALGLIEAARRCYALAASELFGVRAIVLSIFYLSVLNKPTVESAKHLARAEFGAVVGCERAPCVKTLRRKLASLAAQGKAAAFGEALAIHWVEEGIVSTAYLYVDGHVKEYAGRRKLAEIWNTKRRMPTPGVLTYYVSDLKGRPLLFVPGEVSANLAKAMPGIVAAVRKVIGDRAFSVIFDRGGYDGGLFSWLDKEGIGFITYQRGTPNLPRDRFSRREARFEGARIRYWLAEDQVKVARSGPWRRIVIRVTKGGHQTPIITNLGEQLGAARIACLMLARWRQENFFRYMHQHHGLDQLVSYGHEEANDVLVPNPEIKTLTREIAAKKKEAAELRGTLGEAVLNEPRSSSKTAHGLKVASGGAVGRLRVLEAEIGELHARRKALPDKVLVSETGRTREVMRLEHKAIVDRIKICAYNAEEWLVDRLIAHYPNRDDIRDLLRSFADLSGEIDTTPEAVVVTLDAPDTPLHRRALRGLCDDLNAVGATFPGTDFPVVYRVRMHRSETR